MDEISDMEFYSAKRTELSEQLVRTESRYSKVVASKKVPELNSTDTEVIYIHNNISEENFHYLNMESKKSSKSISSEKLLVNIIYTCPEPFDVFLSSGDLMQSDVWDYEGDDAEWRLMEGAHILTPKTIIDAETDILFKEYVRVKFRTITNETMISVFDVTSTIRNIKDRIAKVFKIGTDQFLLKFKGQECDDKAQLIEFGDEELEPIEFEIDSKNPDVVAAPGEFSRYIPYVTYQTVQIHRDLCDKHVSVVIENQAFVKRWLGGYKNRTTKVHYHHASVQTLPRKRPPGSLPQLTRETQTPVFPLKETLDDTPVSKGVQMWRTDHYIPTVFDKILVGDPDRFESKIRRYTMRSIALLLMKVKSLFKIYYRNKEIRLEEERRKECLEIERKGEIIRKEELAEEMKKLTTGCVYPSKRDDFYQLYLQTEIWWKKQQQNILKTRDSEARKAKYCELLNKEVEFLSLIDRKRIESKKEVLMKQDMNFLETCGRPIIFSNNTGKMSSIDTTDTQQAREYQEILSSYINKNISKEQRMDMLCTLKALIQSTYYSPELVDLLERELNLMSIGLTNKELEGLRDRVKQLLIYHLHNVDVNPSCKRYKKMSHPRTDNKLYLCLSCNKLKMASDFNVHVKMTSFSQCYSCEWLKTIGVKRINLDSFARILNSVRQFEMEKCCYSSICFVLQPVGMMYLVSNIWASESIISREKDLVKLRMVRFRRNEDWTPWNCILLTLEESAVHSNIRNFNEFYSQPLLDRIYWKHLRAKMHFMPLLLNDRFMEETRLWFNVQDKGKFLHPSHITRFAQHEDFEYIS